MDKWILIKEIDLVQKVEEGTSVRSPHEVAWFDSEIEWQDACIAHGINPYPELTEELDFLEEEDEL